MNRHLLPQLLFAGSIALLAACRPTPQDASYLMTVNGPIPADSMGLALIHEHVFLDWSGADSINPADWDEEAAFRLILPYLQEMKTQGVRTFLECTPAWLGRNPRLLRQLADSTGLQILTNTGYYGARNDAHLPGHAYTETAEQLARRWVQEWEAGIEATGIRPGFIKIGVEVPLSPLHEKLVRAAAMAHLETGLAIVAHTGPEVGAFRELEILAEEGVVPEALVWTHAQQGARESHVEIARRGAWVSLDGMGWIDPADHQGDSTALMDYIGMLQNLKAHRMLHRTLISHDAGWYTHGSTEQAFKPFTTIFRLVIPELEKAGFTAAEIRQLLVENPKAAYAIHTKRRKR
jgi:phosphotriesterase-related protein